MLDLEKERRAYEMLLWAHDHDRIISSDAKYDPHLAESGFYTTHQKRRSDAALDAFEKEHPYETSPELSAFKKLEEIKVYTQDDFYSPTKAKEGFYTSELKRRTARERTSRLGRTQSGYPKRKRTRRLLGIF